MIGSEFRTARVWLSAAMLVASGCGAGVPYVMQAVEGRDVPPPSEGMAGIVFVMPGGRGDPVSFVDESGAFLGQVRAGSYLVREATPGTHRFYALRGASAYVVSADMQAGATYHALIEAGTLAGIRFVALRPGDRARWMERDRWITEARRVEDDPSADRGALDRVLGNVPQRILEADTEFGRMSAALQAERTLARGDGIVVESGPSAEPTEGAVTPEGEGATSTGTTSTGTTSTETGTTSTETGTTTTGTTSTETGTTGTGASESGAEATSILPLAP